jgi:Leu/Phe-tRNA-protein transferase
MAKEDAEMLLRDLRNDMNNEHSEIKFDGSFCQIINGVAEVNNNAETWQSRREIFSIVAPKITLKVLQLFKTKA